MNTKCLKLILLVIIGMFVAQMGCEEVKAYNCIDVSVGGNTSAGRLPLTHAMKVTLGTYADSECVLEDKSYEAYCAFYWYEAPMQGTLFLRPSHFSNNFSLTHDKVEISQRLAMGVARIMQAEIAYPDSDADNSGIDRVIRTTAINLYLSKQTGVNRFYKGNSIGYEWNYDSSGIVGANKNNISDMVAAFENTLANEEDTTENFYNQTVAKLYKEAMKVTEGNEEPKIEFTDNTKKLTLDVDRGVYSATFVIESNFDLREQIAVDVTGVNDNAIYIDVSGSARKKTIEVSFPKNAVSESAISSGKVRVTVTATANQESVVLYHMDDGVNSQPLVFAWDQDLIGTAYDYVKVQAEKEVGIEKLCYRYESSCDAVSCDNTNASNQGNCHSYIKPYAALKNCDANDIGVSTSGKRTYIVNDTCSLYCTEKATVSYPGNPKPVAFPNNLVWPSTTNGPYPLATHANLTCKLEMNDGSPVTEECKNQLSNRYNLYTYQNEGNNMSDATLAYQRPEVVEGPNPWIAPSFFNHISLEKSCESSNFLREDGVTVDIINNCSYTLPSNFNVAISKNTLEYVEKFKVDANAAIKNYIIMKNGGVIPIGEKIQYDSNVITSTLFSSKYKLVPTVLLGNNNQFGVIINGSDDSSAYTCRYEVTTDIEARLCACPTGTKREGADLYPDIATYNKNNSENPINCAEAQHRFCDILIPNYNLCPPDSQHPDRMLDNCLLTNDYATCVIKEECYDNSNVSEFCTRPDGTKVNITDCLKSNNRKVCEEQNGCSEGSSGPSCTTVDGDTKYLSDCMNGTGIYAGTGGKDEVTCIDIECPGSKKPTCPPGTVRDGEKIDEIYVKSCVHNGKTEEWCINDYCNSECPPGDSNCDYKCPKGSDKYPMNITSCIGSERGKGKNLNDALKACYLQCYNDGGKNAKIIYRTISLENPFPSMDADKSVSSTDLSIGKFNDTVKGRYPGTNWNGITLVRDKILNNRGYDGSSIYKEAEPLYVINLDAASIKKIRAYNKTQNKNDNGYADFTLDCTEGAYCISTFLHSKLGEFNVSLGGTCKDASNKTGFNTCYKTK